MSEDKPTLKKRIPVPFFLNLAAYPGAGSFAGLSSDAISFAYKVVKVQAHFRDDAANNLQVWCYVSRSRQVGTAPPPDNKILGFYSPTPYLIGEGEIVAVDCDVVPDPEEKYLKVYFCNFNAYAMSGYCVITIETLEGITPEQEASLYGIADERKYTLEDFKKIYENQTHALHDQVLDFLSGTPGWVEKDRLYELRGAGQTQSGQKTDAAGIATMTNYFKPKMELDEFYEALHKWFGDASNLMSGYSTYNILGIISGLGRVNFASDLIQRDEATWGITDEMAEINKINFDASMNEYARQHANFYFQAKIPAVADIINMRVKEKITWDEYVWSLKKNGLSDFWAEKIWDAHFYAPDFATVLRAYHRGFIAEAELPDMMKRVDLDPFYNDKVWMALKEEIPPYMDLINMRVKEVITQETFEKGIQAWGYYTPWAQRLWDAHFTPASFSDFLTAMRRKLNVTIPVAEGEPKAYTFGENEANDIETVKDLSVLADYDPRYWDFFKTRIYNDPSYRMIMWGFEAGAIKFEDVPDLVHRLGLNPKDENWYGKFLTTFQERPWVNRYLTTLMAAYVSGAIDDAQLEYNIITIPRNKAIAGWIKKIAYTRKLMAAKGKGGEEQQLLTVGELKKGYVYGLINEDDFRTRLLGRGLTLLDVDLLISIMAKEHEIEEVGGKKEGLTVAELFDAYRYAEINEDQLRTELMTKGLNLDQVNILINTKKKKWEIGGVEGVTE